MKAEPTGRSDVVKRGEAVVATLETTADKNAATVYLKVMEKVLATGDEYITKETARVNKLLKGKLSDEKKTSMRLRLNVLASFTLPPPAETAKEELWTAETAWRKHWNAGVTMTSHGYCDKV